MTFQQSEKSGCTPNRISDVTGVILSGGKSLRYGSNKAWILVGGVPLIRRVASVLFQVFSQVMMVTNTPEEYESLHLPMVEDICKGLGPLGGIHAALETLPTETGFFVACDMPQLNAALIRYMVGVREEGCDAVVPRINGHMEALHALYSKACLPAIRDQIHTGRYQVLQLFSRVSVRYVGREEVRRFDPDYISFRNINSPQELRRFHLA